MAADCNTPGCNRLRQIKGPIRGGCCALCLVKQGAGHTNNCNMIEAEANAEIGEPDNIVLGYN